MLDRFGATFSIVFFQVFERVFYLQLLPFWALAQHRFTAFAGLKTN